MKWLPIQEEAIIPAMRASDGDFCDGELELAFESFEQGREWAAALHLASMSTERLLRQGQGAELLELQRESRCSAQAVALNAGPSPQHRDSRRACPRV